MIMLSKWTLRGLCPIAIKYPNKNNVVHNVREKIKQTNLRIFGKVTVYETRISQ